MVLNMSLLSWHCKKQSPEVFYKKGVHKYVAIFAEETLSWSHILVSLSTRPATFLKKGL